MNAYDFDKTIYDGDSTIDFYLYCLRIRPQLVSYLFGQGYGIFLHVVKKIDTTEMKERFFAFLQGLPDTAALVDAFWELQFPKIQNWYLQQKAADDVVISASPMFLLEPVCHRLHIPRAIATEMDLHTGKIYGRNCKGEEKVRRFQERYPNSEIQRFYSDSLSDAPMAALAQNAFLVKNGRPVPWRKCF